MATMEENEKIVMSDHLASLENELQRRDDLITSLNIEKSQLLTELAESHSRNKELEKRLQEIENAEYEQAGLAQQLRCSLQEANLKSKKEAEAYCSSLEQLQDKLKLLNSKYVTGLENQDFLAAELDTKNQELEELQSQKNKLASESSSRIANLNQILLHTKQLCSQLEARNEELLLQEKMIMSECEKLEKKCETLTSPCTVCIEREKAIASHCEATARHIQKSISTPIIPLTVLPEQSEVDHLKKENVKLNQKYDCLLVNFQIMSEKCGQMKQEMKENEKHLIEFQTQCDGLLKEKEELLNERKKSQYHVSEPRHNSSLVTEHTHNQCQLKEEVTSLSEELGDIRGKYDRLQGQYDSIALKLKKILCTIAVIQCYFTSLDVAKADHESVLHSTQSEIKDLMADVLKSVEEDGVDMNDSIAEVKKVCIERLNDIQKGKKLLEHRNEELSSQVAVYQDQKASMESMIEKMKLEIESITEQLQISKQSLAKVSDENVSLCSQVNALIEKNEQLVAENNDLTSIKDSFVVQIDDLKKSAAKYHQESLQSNDSLCSMQTQLQRMKLKLSSVQEDLESKNIKLSALEHFKHVDDCTVTEEAMQEEELSELYSKLENLETSNFELHARCTEISSARNSLQLSLYQMEENVSNLQTKLHATEEVLQQKEVDLDEAKTVADMLSLENTKLLAKHDQLSKVSMTTNEENNLLKAQLADVEYQNSVLAREVKDLENAHVGCEPKRDKLERDQDKLRHSLMLVENNLELQEKEMESHSVKMAQLQQYNDSLESIVDDLQCQLKVHHAKLDEVKAEKDRAVSELKKRLEFQQVEARSLEQEKERIRNELQKLKTSLQNKLDSTEEKYHTLHRNHNDLIATHESTLSHLSSLEPKVEELQQIATEAKAEKEEAVMKMEGLRDETGRFQKEAETLRHQMREMKRDLRYHKNKVKEQERFMEMNISEYSSAVQQFRSLRSNALHILSDGTSSYCDDSYPSRRRHFSGDESDITRPVQSKLEL